MDLVDAEIAFDCSMLRPGRLLELNAPFTTLTPLQARNVLAELRSNSPDTLATHLFRCAVAAKRNPSYPSCRM